jgi:hypothetical protein
MRWILYPEIRASFAAREPTFSEDVPVEALRARSALGRVGFAETFVAEISQAVVKKS